MKTRHVFHAAIMAFALSGMLMVLPLPADAAEPLCVRLKWFHQSQFAGFYIAAEDGYYRRAGLDLTFIEGGPQVDWQAAMADPSCPVGVTNAYEIAIARERGIPVRAVAAIAQVSPIVFFSLQSSGIIKPHDLKGRSIALVPTGRIHLMGMLRRTGVPLSSVRMEHFTMDMKRLYDGRVDVWSGYHTNLVTMAEEEGYRLNIIHPADYGVQIYDDVIYAREELIKDQPEKLGRFLDASLRGWREAVRDPALGLRQTLKYSSGRPDLVERKMLERTIPYVHTGEVPVGWMELSVWEDICYLTREVGLTRGLVNAPDVFTVRFLHEIYPREAARAR